MPLHFKNGDIVCRKNVLCFGCQFKNLRTKNIQNKCFNGYRKRC
jgi:hypothetical protein